MPTVIADVTRHNNSATLMRLKTTIDQYVSMVYPVSVGLKVKWVLTGGQMTVLKGLDSVASTTLPGTDHPRRISAYVQSLAQNGSSGDIFHVLTYDQSVMDEVSKLDVNIKIVPIHFGTIFTLVNQTNRFGHRAMRTPMLKAVSAPVPVIPETKPATVGSTAVETKQKESPITEPKSVARWKDFETVLKHERIGTHSEVRAMLFDAVETVVTNPNFGGLPPGRLIARAAEEVHPKVPELLRKNWSTVAECFQRMMMRAGAFLRKDEKGELVRINDGTWDDLAIVVNVQGDFRDLCEAYLLERLIANKPVTLDDNYFLAMALFHQGKQDLQFRAGILEKNMKLLKRLVDTGRVVFEGRSIKIASD